MHLLVFFLLIVVTNALSAAEIKGIRAWQEDGQARVVFDLSGAVQYNVFRMRNPDRVVIDFKQSQTPAPLRLPAAPRAVVQQVRHARRGKDDLRVVLDLGERVVVTDSALPPESGYGHRLVLDLAPASGAASPGKAGEAAVRTVERAEQATERVVSARPADRSRSETREFVVAIDAGHGGEDVGAVGPSGLYEKDVTLATAQALAAEINRQPGMRAVLTRDSDRYLKLRERMERARARKADLFISVHADAFRDRRVKGSSVYVLSQRGASSEAAKWLAEKENAADLIGGVSLDDKDHLLKSVLLDLSQSASLDASMDLAGAVLTQLKRIGPVHRKEVQHAGFMVLKSPDIPSILIETAFISNPAEETRLRSKKYRQQLAAAIFSGVRQYLNENPPTGVHLAAQREHRVRRGDTLSEIADRYDITLASLRLANNLESDRVQAGALLRIP